MHYNCGARRLGDPYRSAASACVCLSEMCMTLTDRLWGRISIRVFLFVFFPPHRVSLCVHAVHAAAESGGNTHFVRKRGLRLRCAKTRRSDAAQQAGGLECRPTCSTGGASERGLSNYPSVLYLKDALLAWAEIAVFCCCFFGGSKEKPDGPSWKTHIK